MPLREEVVLSSSSSSSGSGTSGQQAPESWSDRGAAHRWKLTEWLLQSAESGANRMLAIGPGIAGHLDLPRLQQRGIDLTLADFDPRTLDAGLALHRVTWPSERQVVIEDPAGIRDVCRTLGMRRAERGLGFHDVQEGIEAAQRPLIWPLEGSFDLILSAEALGAVCGAAVVAVGSENPSLPEWHRAIVDAHLATLVGRLSPGGFGIVVNAIVSTASMPSLPQVPDDRLEGLMQELLNRRAVPAFVDPRLLQRSLELEPRIRERLAGVTLLRPWRFGHERGMHAFSGVSFRVV